MPCYLASTGWLGKGHRNGVSSRNILCPYGWMSGHVAVGLDRKIQGWPAEGDRRERQDDPKSLMMLRSWIWIRVSFTWSRKCADWCSGQLWEVSDTAPVRCFLHCPRQSSTAIKWNVLKVRIWNWELGRRISCGHAKDFNNQGEWAMWAWGLLLALPEPRSDITNQAQNPFPGKVNIQGQLWGSPHLFPISWGSLSFPAWYPVFHIFCQLKDSLSLNYHIRIFMFYNYIIVYVILYYSHIIYTYYIHKYIQKYKIL